jgi:endonuclease G, mitochondrial
MEVLSRALGELAASADRPYFDEEADGRAAEQYYTGVEPSGTRLGTLLAETHLTKPRYSPATELYPWVDLQPDRMVRSVYTLEEFDPKELIEEAARIHERRESLRVTAASEDAVEELEPYNCEHVVCQSWFEHAEPMRGDLHHLFTCERKCNSFRGNAHYTDFPDYLEVVRESCGKKETELFEPANGKGAVARATFYFLLRYPALEAYSADSMGTLLRWHEVEPVSEYERHRNAAVFERQGNRNPFVDHPGWAAQADFSAAA